MKIQVKKSLKGQRNSVKKNGAPVALRLVNESLGIDWDSRASPVERQLNTRVVAAAVGSAGDYDRFLPDFG